MKTRLLGGIVAVVLALTGTLLLVSYVQASDARAQQDLQPVDVLVVQEPVPAGSSIDNIRSATKLTSLPSVSVPSGALTSLEGFDGNVATADLLPGEPLLEARLADRNSVSGPGSAAVPEGMQEISVQLEAQRAVGGRIAAGDTVGVVALFDKGALPDAPEAESAQQIFHKVLVTSVQRPADEASATEDTAGQANTASPTGELIVTFALNSHDATKVAFGANYGQLWLTKEPSTAAEDSPIVKKPELYR